MNNLQPIVSYTYHLNGNIQTEIWKFNGKAHNQNGPAYKVYNDNNQLIREDYFIDGKLHNSNGSAIKAWNDNNQLIYEIYCIDDKTHNPNGPAVRRWNNNHLTDEEYWINNVKVDKSVIKKRNDNPISSTINNDIQVNPPY